jgi:hypothetical protein
LRDHLEDTDREPDQQRASEDGAANQDGTPEQLRQQTQRDIRTHASLHTVLVDGVIFFPYFRLTMSAGSLCSWQHIEAPLLVLNKIDGR